MSGRIVDPALIEQIERIVHDALSKFLETTSPAAVAAGTSKRPAPEKPDHDEAALPKRRPPSVPYSIARSGAAVAAGTPRKQQAPEEPDPDEAALLPPKRPPREQPAAYGISTLIQMGPLGATTIRTMIAKGILPVHRYGRRTFVLRRDWETLLEACPTGTNRAVTAAARAKNAARRRKATDEAAPATRGRFDSGNEKA